MQRLREAHQAGMLEELQVCEHTGRVREWTCEGRVTLTRLRAHETGTCMKTGEWEKQFACAHACMKDGGEAVWVENLLALSGVNSAQRR